MSSRWRVRLRVQDSLGARVTQNKRTKKRTLLRNIMLLKSVSFFSMKINYVSSKSVSFCCNYHDTQDIAEKYYDTENIITDKYFFLFLHWDK